MGPSPAPLSGDVANAVYDDLGACRLIEHDVGIGAEDEAAKAGSLRRDANIRLDLQDRNRFLDAAGEACGPLRRALLDIVEDGEQLPQRPSRVAKPHRRKRAQTAVTSSLVANSPFSASAIEASRSASSSGESG